MQRSTLEAAVVAGLATGPRSFTGLAAVVFATPPASRAQPDRVLGHPAVKTGIGLLALQEWVMDKLPKTPSRLEVLGLATRSTGAGAAGAILARRAQVREAAARRPDPTVEGVAPSAAAAAAAPVSGPSADDIAPDWAAIGIGAAASAGTALAVAVIGVQLRGMFGKLFGQDWPGAALEDVSSAGLAAAAVYLAGRA